MLALHNELQQYQQAIMELQPHAPIIERLVSDPDAKKFVQEALASYTEMQKRREPELPAELRPLESKITKLNEYVENLQQREQQATQAAQQQAFQAEYAYAERLVAQHPELAEDNYFAIQALKQYATQNGISLEQAYKRRGSQFLKQDTAPALPSSLRADLGELGVPTGERSTGAAPPTAVSFRDALLAKMRQEQRGA